MSDESKVLVGLGSPEVRGGPPTIILGMTPESWKKLESGNTHTFDLRKAGINVQILIFRGENHDEIAKTMAQGAAAAGAPFTDTRGTGKLPDLGIDEPTKQ